MFNRRNFAQIVASLLPLPFLKLPKLDLKEDEGNTENLPVIRFVEINGVLQPDEKQFEKELMSLTNGVRYGSGKHIREGVKAWLRKEHATFSIATVHHTSRENFLFWGKVYVSLYASAGTVYGYRDVHIGFDISSIEESYKISLPGNHFRKMIKQSPLWLEG